MTDGGHAGERDQDGQDADDEDAGGREPAAGRAGHGVLVVVAVGVGAVVALGDDGVVAPLVADVHAHEGGRRDSEASEAAGTHDRAEDFRDGDVVDADVLVGVGDDRVGDQHAEHAEHQRHEAEELRDDHADQLDGLGDGPRLDAGLACAERVLDERRESLGLGRDSSRRSGLRVRGLNPELAVVLRHEVDDGLTLERVVADADDVTQGLVVQFDAAVRLDSGVLLAVGNGVERAEVLPDEGNGRLTVERHGVDADDVADALVVEVEHGRGSGGSGHSVLRFWL